MTSIFTICTSVPNDFSKNHILTFRELPRWNLRKLQPHTTLSLMAVISQSEEKEKELFCNFFMKFYRPHTVPFDLFSSRADYGKERTKSSRRTLPPSLVLAPLRRSKLNWESLRGKIGGCPNTLQTNAF